MAWFKIDDSSHMHPKIVKAGNAALGLWVRAGAYSAQHLTEGTVPAVVARQYGTAPQARKLVTVGLWHEHGHTCPRCPQPPSATSWCTISSRAVATAPGRRSRPTGPPPRSVRRRAARETRLEPSTNRPRIVRETSADRRRIESETHPCFRRETQVKRGCHTVTPSIASQPPSQHQALPQYFLRKYWETS